MQLFRGLLAKFQLASFKKPKQALKVARLIKIITAIVMTQDIGVFFCQIIEFSLAGTEPRGSLFHWNSVILTVWVTFVACTPKLCIWFRSMLTAFSLNVLGETSQCLSVWCYIHFQDFWRSTNVTQGFRQLVLVFNCKPRQNGLGYWQVTKQQ